MNGKVQIIALLRTYFDVDSRYVKDGNVLELLHFPPSTRGPSTIDGTRKLIPGWVSVKIVKIQKQEEGFKYLVL